MSDTLWYTKMNAAMKRREKASKALQRWQLELAEAEAEILALRESDVSDAAAPTEAPAPVDPHTVEFVKDPR